MSNTILIVEDEIRIRFLLRDYLKKDGFNVLEASDGEEALNIYSQTNVDLLILDVMMPKIDGFNVCKAIRKVSNVPIIILTAKSEEEEFRAIYGLDVLEIPTNRPVARIDMPDVIYKTVKGKNNAIIKEINAVV